MDPMPLIDALLQRLLAASAQALVLAALAWALCRYLPRLDARTRAWLWWLVAMQMVVGLLWHAPVGLPLLPADPAPAQLAVSSGLSSAGAVSSAMPALAVQASVEDGPALPATVWLALAWLAGVAAMLANTLRHAVRLRGQILRSRSCDDRRVRAEYDALARRLGIAAPPALRVSDEIDSPQLARPWRPVLMLPAVALATMGADDLRMALHHELAHLQRRDLWLGWVPALAQHLFFFHPAAHLAAREYGFAREVACDAAVLADERHAPRDYGRLLVKLGVATAPSPALASASPTFRILKRRLSMLQQTATPLRAGALALTLGIVALGAVPYRVIARNAPVAAPVAVPAASPAPAPQAVPAAAPSPAAAPRPLVVADAREMPAPPAPPAPAKAPAPAVAPAPPPPAPPAPPSAPKGATTWSIGGPRDGDAYVLLDGDDVTMVAHSDDIRTARGLQQGNAPVLWLRKDGAQYVVRDAATVERVKAAHAPVEALGAQQGRLGERQGTLGERQGRLGAKQGELGAKMAAIATQQAAAALTGGRGGRDQDVERRMEALAKEQEALARQQEALARQQEPLAREQEALARRQEAAVTQMQRDMERLLDAAIRSGKAQRL